MNLASLAIKSDATSAAQRQAITRTANAYHGHGAHHVGVVVVVVEVVIPEVVAALALPTADSISAIAGGVTAAKRPAFSRNRRRATSFVDFVLS